MINIALLIQSTLYFELLSKRLKQEKDISITRRIAGEKEVLELIDSAGTDILFIDSSAVNINYLKIIKKIDDANSSLGLIVLFNYYDMDLFVNAISSGIDGCLNMNSGFSDLIQALRTVNDGGIWADNEVMTTALKGFIKKNDKSLKTLSASLTNRELEIAELLLQGLSNKAIAKKLYISEKTVKTHTSHIFKKLGIKHRYELNPRFIETIGQFKSIKT